MKRFVPLLVVLIALFALDCAYFNAFYLAQKNFKNGERLRKRDNGIPGTEAKKMYNDAVKWAREVIDEYPDSRYVDDSIFIIGMSRYYQNDYVIARAQFDDLISRFPGSKNVGEARFFSARSYIGLGQYENARIILNDIMQNSDIDNEMKGRVGLASADIALLTESWEELLTSAQAVIDSDPGENELMMARYMKGEALYRLDKNEECIETLKKLDGKKLDPDIRVKVNTRIAQSTAKLGKYEEGLNYLAELEKKGEYKQFAPRIRLEIGYIYELKKDFEEAADTYSKMAADFPDSLPSKEAWFRVGEIRLRDLSVVDDARDAFTKVGKPSKNTRETYFADAAIRIAQIDTMKAIIKRIDDNKDKPDIKTKARFSLAELYTYSFNRPDSAMTQYSAIMEESPGSEFAVMSDFYYRCNETESQGELTPEKERSIIESVIDTYPDSEFAGKLKAYIGVDDMTPHIIALKRAEEALYSGKSPDEYIPLYQAVADSFPETRSAFMARYVLAYTYEHELDDIDTALEYYRALADEQPDYFNSEYVLNAREKLKYYEKEPELIAEIKEYLDGYEERKIRGFAEEEADSTVTAVAAMKETEDAGLTEYKKIRARNARIRSRYFTN